MIWLWGKTSTKLKCVGRHVARSVPQPISCNSWLNSVLLKLPERGWPPGSTAQPASHSLSPPSFDAHTSPPGTESAALNMWFCPGRGSRVPGKWLRALVIAATDMDAGEGASGWRELACAKQSKLGTGMWTRGACGYYDNFFKVYRAPFNWRI